MAKGCLENPNNQTKKAKPLSPPPEDQPLKFGKLWGEVLRGASHGSVLRKTVVLLTCQAPAAGPGQRPCRLFLKVLGVVFQCKCKQYKTKASAFPPCVPWLFFHSLPIHVHWVLVSA